MAVLNVIVQHPGLDGLVNERASVRAAWVDPLGRRTAVEMREVIENGFVSYLGIYRHRRDRTLRFEIKVLPDGAPRWIDLQFEDRLAR